jgi:DNA-binding response OmpR family regulator
MNILLAEDDELMLKALSFKLTENGHSVSIANDGSIAIDITMSNPFDLIICDLMMPIVSGVTFLSMRENFMSTNVPVIIMSSLGEADEVLKKLNIPFGFFIRKPIQFEKLFELIEQIQLTQESIK